MSGDAPPASVYYFRWRAPHVDDRRIANNLHHTTDVPSLAKRGRSGRGSLLASVPPIHLAFQLGALVVKRGVLMMAFKLLVCEPDNTH